MIDTMAASRAYSWLVKTETLHGAYGSISNGGQTGNAHGNAHVRHC